MPALRILHLDAGTDWRGAERQLLLLADAQRAAGSEPLVAAARGTPLLRRARAAGHAVAAVTVRGEWDVVAARRLRRLVRMWRPDVVHANDPRAHGVALMALLGRPVPLVVTRRTATRIPARAALKFRARVARFVALTGAVRDALVAAGADAALVDVVPPAVPAGGAVVPRQWRAERGWPPGAVVCGVLGAPRAVAARLGAAHGESDDPLAQLAAACPPVARSQLRLVVFGGPAAGSGDLAGVPAFRAGLVDDMPGALSGLDLLWHLPATERFGMTVLEAMALGVPTIALPTAGLEELVGHGSGVHLVRARAWPAAVAEIARTTTRLAGDAAARHAAAAAARQAAARFSVARMCDAVFCSYAAALHTAPSVERA